MSTGHFELLTKIQEYITEHYRQKVDPKFIFHDLVHTQQVVAACAQLAEHYRFSEDDRCIL
jgi:hypothetical protein